MKWYRYRSHWSSHVSSWEYAYVCWDASDSDIGDIVAEDMDRNNWSDHYRGYDWEWTTPPKEVVDDRLRAVTEEIASLEKTLEFLKKYQESM
ncbi:hypothetical protein RsoM2USA_339 [Ralstonia phage RsoM2USA]|nr:hypothetical protein RsoM2USA_339 [Ralstonia phage RsoM2USA]